MINNTALVLEGGGFRGIFTAGILEVFIEKNLFFKSVYGVSAGASYGVSYISKQAGRNLAVNKYIGDKRYCSINNLLRKGSLFSWEFIYEEIPQQLVPFDYETLQASESNVYIVASNCITAEAEYMLLNNANKTEFKTILSASCSLPLIAPIANYNGAKLLDGGLANSIPFKHALNNGHEKALVILTQPKDYRKSALKFAPLIKWYYRKYPKVYKMLLSRAQRYNESLNKIEQLEQEGKIYVIRPNASLPIKRLENDPQKTEKVYFQAMEKAREEFSNIEKWIKQ